MNHYVIHLSLYDSHEPQTFKAPKFSLGQDCLYIKSDIWLPSVLKSLHANALANKFVQLYHRTLLFN